jgi:hypothetical protein
MQKYTLRKGCRRHKSPIFNDLSRLMQRGGRAAGRAFSGLVFWDVSIFRSSSEYTADLSAFRQQHRGFRSALACKLERFCLVP